MPDSSAFVGAYSDPNATTAIASPSYYMSSASAYQHQSQAFAGANSSSVKTKKKKEKLSKSETSSKKPKAEKAPRPEKPPKPQKPEKVPKNTKKSLKTVEKLVRPPKPTRVLSRARKIVNYSEEKSRSPTPSSQTKAARNETTPETDAVEVAAIIPVPSSEKPNPNQNEFFETNNENTLKYSNDEQFQNSPSGSPSKNPLGDHPPIVLRISKVGII